VVGGPAVAFPPIKPGGGYGIQLAVGNQGLFFLQKHHEGDFYILPMFGTFVNSQNNPGFNNELDTTKKTLKVLQNPTAGLKSANADERLETAYTLITMYRTVPFGSPANQQPINAEESKLILKTLLEADWDAAKYQGTKFQQNPAQLFNRLGITQADGFQPPVNLPFNSPEYANTLKNWLAQNWQTYQIKKFVPGAAKVGLPGNPGLPGGPGVGPGGIQIQPFPLPPNGPGGIQVQPLPVQPVQPLPPAGVGGIQIQIQPK
jgi:hypothetical protein